MFYKDDIKCYRRSLLIFHKKVKYKYSHSKGKVSRNGLNFAHGLFHYNFFILFYCTEILFKRQNQTKRFYALKSQCKSHKIEIKEITKKKLDICNLTILH